MTNFFTQPRELEIGQKHFKHTEKKKSQPRILYQNIF